MRTKKELLIWISFVSLVGLCLGSDQDQVTGNPLVETKLGKIEGVWRKSSTGRDYAAFEGIPYAKAPVGDLRFRNPVAVEPWQGTLKANNPTMCSQRIMFPTPSVLGQEDCLHLNIYVPKTVLENQTLTEVVLNIHGGGFMVGSGHGDANAGFLMDNDIVFATLNYRLGVLGFLSTNDQVIPGNFGMKDQSMALIWIQNHVQSFKGNPKSVTLTGVSAGAAAVHYHFLSPLSRGMFRRAISQSGTALNSWALERKPLDNAVKLAKALGCTTDTSQQIRDCLVAKSDKDLLAGLDQFANPFGLTIKFVPVVETGKDGDEGTFINMSPKDSMDKGLIYDAPWITSVTREEGLLFLKLVEKDLDSIENKWNETAPHLLQYTTSVNESMWATVAEKIRKQYLGDQSFSSETILQLIRIIGDRLSTYDAETAARLHASKVRSPVYFYRFNYAGDLGLARLMPGKITMKCPSHGDDTFYWFPYAAYNFTIVKEEDRRMKDVFVKFLIDFAKEGKAQLGNLTNWTQVPKTGGTTHLLEINGPEGSDMNFDQDLTPRAFWRDLNLENEKTSPRSKNEL